MNNLFRNSSLWKNRDKKKRLATKNQENFQLSLKLYSDMSKKKVSYNLKNFKFKFFSNRVSIRNKCLLTGTYSNVLSQFKLSRSNFRGSALEGLLPGIRKSIW